MVLNPTDGGVQAVALWTANNGPNPYLGHDSLHLFHKRELITSEISLPAMRHKEISKYSP